MNKKALLIIGVVMIAALIVLGKPLLEKESEQASANPYAVFQESLAAGKPMFIDFFGPR